MPYGLAQRLRRVHLRLSGNLDRAEPLPPPAGLQAWLLPAADLVMVLLYSRSRAGSLRSVRVTLATISLSATVFTVAAGASAALLLHSLSPLNALLLLGALLAAALAVASGILAAYGILQRATIRRTAAGQWPPPARGPRAS